MAVARRWPRAIRASVGNVKYGLAQRDIPAERQRGTEMLAKVRDLCLQQRYFRIHLPVVEICAARERFRVGDFDEAIPAMRQAVDELFRAAKSCRVFGAQPSLRRLC